MHIICIASHRAVSRRIALCHAAPHRWGAWFVASAELRPGDALFAPYGVGSTHHDSIRDAAAVRAAREPACNARKRKRAAQLQQARAARDGRGGVRRCVGLKREVRALGVLG